ncbi:hypothetical protein IX51_10465 [uncultured archaeon]|nr:hypothetical protein IX51_10465 [uncultured archaeon]HKJ96188.1 hypothetical protein [Thermoplasmataceae archaeon]
MDRDRKIMASSIIGGVVIVSIIIMALIFPSLFPNNNSAGNTHFNLANFDARSLEAGNNTLSTIGLSAYHLNPPGANSSLTDYFVTFPPGDTVTGILNDNAVYLKNNGSYTVYENTTFKTDVVTVLSVLTNDSVIQSIAINNTGDELQTYSFSYHLFIPISGNTTLYNYTPYGSSPQNFTIVPSTFGFSESYSFPATGPVAVGFPYYNDTLVSWSDLFGVYKQGSITFNHQGTQLGLEFGEVRLPPGDSLNFGTITLKY